MPIIRVEMFKGRSREQKRVLARELTAAFVRTAGGTASDMYVVITDVDKENWGLGGELACDLYPDPPAGTS